MSFRYTESLYGGTSSAISDDPDNLVKSAFFFRNVRDAAEYAKASAEQDRKSGKTESRALVFEYDTSKLRDPDALLILPKGGYYRISGSSSELDMFDVDEGIPQNLESRMETVKRNKAIQARFRSGYFTERGRGTAVLTEPEQEQYKPIDLELVENQHCTDNVSSFRGRPVDLDSFRHASYQPLLYGRDRLALLNLN